MSKKIIYLLSLLMALSLVFASCKKNNPGDPTGGVNPPPEIDETPQNSTGLFENKDDLAKYNDGAIKDEPVLTSRAGLYFRNPIVVVMGANHNQVVVISERRHETRGSVNDIGINGSIATDIVYTISANSGGRFSSTEGDVVAKAGGAGESGGKVGYAAPVVFKISDDTLVVVASSGGGISRSATAYDSRPENEKSKLVYAIGKVTGDGQSMTWSTEWKDMTTTVKDAIAADNTVKSYAQFGTHSARGFTVGTGSVTMYLPVVVAQQGTSSAPQEKMGNIFFKADVQSTLETSGTITWTAMNKSAAFTASGSFSSFKESRVISGTSDGDIKYIAVGSPTAGMYKVGTGDIGGNPSASGISGSEGSPAYLTVANWYGETPYEPASYNYTTGTAKSMFMHVSSQDKNLTFYLLNDGFTVDGKGLLLPAPKTGALDAKSSSMDVLGDGTVIMVAEQDGGGNRDFKVVFKRYNQYYLTAKTR